MDYPHKHTIRYKGEVVTLTLTDAPPARLEKPLRQRWRVADDWNKFLGYVENPREGIWVARNRIEAQTGDMVRWSQFTTMDAALCCLLRWYEQDLHSADGPADEPDLLAPAGIIPDPRAAAAPAGIALRDWFAGMALAGVLAHETDECNYRPDEAAERAYRMADAMMQERENKSSQGA